MKSLSPAVSNVPEPPSAGSPSGPGCTPSNSRSVLTYSRRFSRRIVVRPPVSASALPATTIALERSSSRSAFAAAVSCSASFGGISPAFKTLSTFRQRSAVSAESISAGSVSIRNPPPASSGPWQSAQWAASSGGVEALTLTTTEGSAAPAAAAARIARSRLTAWCLTMVANNFEGKILVNTK